MSPVEWKDLSGMSDIELPNMSDICFGHEACSGPCQEYNYPNPCPCGLETKDMEELRE